MNVGMRVRGGVFAALIMLATPIAAMLAVSPAFAQAVSSIQVEGNRRIEVETIRSYFKPGPGGRLDQARIDDGLKALIETGLFQDVRISQPGGRLVVTVVENPVIGRIAFEGNKKVKDEQLSAEIQSSRGARCRVPWSSRRPAHRRVIAAPAVMTSASAKSSSSRTAASISFHDHRGLEGDVKSVEFVGRAPIRRIVSGYHQDA
jgi:outer membrane protein insertion porin family